MCDTLCAVGSERTLFAKNSDRPVAEVQLVESFASRRGGGRLRTQYIEIDDAGAFALLGCRPEWLWGLETGVNEHRVAIGNEKVFTVDDPYKVEPALLGMDLVRLGLERGRTADEALDVTVRAASATGRTTSPTSPPSSSPTPGGRGCSRRAGAPGRPGRSTGRRRSPTASRWAWTGRARPTTYRQEPTSTPTAWRARRPAMPTRGSPRAGPASRPGRTR